MSGSSMGKAIVIINGARIAGAPTYTPGYTKTSDGKEVRSMIEFNVFVNSKYDTSVFKCTAWGGYADALARGGAPGKELEFHGELKSFEGRDWEKNAAGQYVPRQMPDGSPVMKKKVGINITWFKFGEDSDGQINWEIANGLRPLHFQTPGHAEVKMWRDECAKRNAAQFVPGSTHFGYAEVRVSDKGPLIQPGQGNTGTAQGPSNQYQGNTQNVQRGFSGAANQQGGWTPPVQQPTAPPVMVNGQNMGQPMSGYPQAPNQAGGYQQPAASTMNRGGSFAPPTTPAMAPGQAGGYQQAPAPLY